MRHVRRGARRAFTLIELMIAVLLSGIVILSVYFVFISTAEQFYRQEQIAQMQDGMRFAVEYLKNDVRNVGRLSIVNGSLVSAGLCEQVADSDGDTVNAIRLYEGEANAQVLGNNNLIPDRVRLLVDASGGTEFTSLPNGAGTRQVILSPAVLQRTTDARRAISEEKRFTAIFKAGYFLHIKSRSSNKFDLVPVDAVQFAAGQPIITLEEPTCMECNGGCIVNPVQFVEYRIQGDESNGDAADVALKTDLVRAVIDARNGAELGGSLRMAEFAVNLQVWGTYDTRATPGATPVIARDDTPFDALGNWPATDNESEEMNQRPERLRGLNILLATRTPREDESHQLNLIDADRPADLIAVDLAPAVPGLARVATLRAEVETPNLNRGL